MEQQSIVEDRATVEQRIEALQRACAADSSVIPLAGGLPACELFPKAELAAAAARVVERDGDQALQYGWPEGREGLRRWVCERLGRRGVELSPEDVILTNGAQQAISIAAHLILGDAGRERHGDAGRSFVRVDAESYPGALDIFRSLACIATTAEESDAARCVYVMPAMSNPRGRVMPAADRAALLDWARRTGGQIIEDDAYADLVWTGAAGAPLLAEDRAHVWYAGTLSKALCPGMRVGWLVPPPDRRARALEHKRLGDLQGCGMVQSIIEDFVARDDFDGRLQKARGIYERKAGALIRAVRRHLPEAEIDEPAGGFSLWVRLPGQGDDTELLAAAARHGVSFDPGSMFRALHPERGQARLEMRVCYSLASVEQIQEGAKRLSLAWRETRKALAS